MCRLALRIAFRGVAWLVCSRKHQSGSLWQWIQSRRLREAAYMYRRVKGWRDAPLAMVLAVDLLLSLSVEYTVERTTETRLLCFKKREGSKLPEMPSDTLQGR